MALPFFMAGRGRLEMVRAVMWDVATYVRVIEASWVIAAAMYVVIATT